VAATKPIIVIKFIVPFLFGNCGVILF
jgi:hypothetical protein